MSNLFAEKNPKNLESTKSLIQSNGSVALPHKSKLYTKLAQTYETLFPFFEWQIKKGLTWHPTKPGHDVLELGVGTGFSLRHYTNQSRILGIDISQEMLESAQQKIDENDLSHVKLSQMSALDLQLPDNSFDVVTAFHAVNVVPDPAQMMREAQRVCRPNGSLLMINYFCGESLLGSLAGRLMDPFTRKMGWCSTLSVRKSLEGTSFEVVSARRTHLVSPYWVVLAKNRK